MAVWRHRRFRLFWLGDTISAAGGAFSAVALPLLALELSDAAVGIVRAAQTLPFLLLAVPVGLLADRIPRRRLLLAADALRFPLMATIALLGGGLGVPGLVALVFLAGLGAVVYEVAYLSVLPELIDGPAELPAANRAVETAHAGAVLLGPAVAGALVAVTTPAAAVGIDALTFLAGALLIAANRWPSPVPGRPGSDRRGGAGWSWLRHDRYVGPFTLYLGVNNVAAQAFQTALLLFVVRTLGLSAVAVGFAVAAGGAGFLTGAAIGPGAARRFRTGRVVVAAAALGASGIAVVAVAPGLPLVIAGAALAGAGPGMLNLHSISVRQARTPPELLGRVNAVVKTVSYGSAASGALIGGPAAAAVGPRMVMAVAAGVSALAAATLAASAVRRLSGSGSA